jgi:cytochrome c biogenesis protein CcdA/thiol-disulfide isomerase/thioredoxin
MTLTLLAFLGGVLTILSPCTLPVLPFVFARSDRSFVRSSLPLLAGMALTFAAVATLAAIGGAWAVRVNAYGRIISLVVLAVLGLALLSGRAAAWLSRPAVALGNRLLQKDAEGAAADTLGSLVLGVATGLLWAPCAGPILGLILTGAALRGPGLGTSALLLAYAAGAATSLALAIFAGRRVFNALRRSLGVGEWVRHGLGALVLLAVVVIGLGLDTGLLTRWSTGSTAHLEQRLVSTLSPQRSVPDAEAGPARDDAVLARLAGATAWINSSPLDPGSLRGKVVLVDFWTYSCINCLRTLPYVRAWYDRYKDHGLVIIGVHSPEFAFEKDEANVRRAVKELGVDYPVAVDSDLNIWRAFANQYWPAHYLVDASGHVRAHRFGEGDYEGTEREIRQLLQEAGQTDLPEPTHGTLGEGIEAAMGSASRVSPETYLGYARAERFSSPGASRRDQDADYALPDELSADHWALQGRWQIGAEHAVLDQAAGQIAFEFQGRDVHLVIGPTAAGAQVRFRVRIDGHAPEADHGVDTDAQGAGLIREQRLYQLVRLHNADGPHRLTIEFPDGGVTAYSFTFG